MARTARASAGRRARAGTTQAAGDGYLRTALDDLLESAAQSPMVLLRARALLTTVLNAAPAARQPITRRLQRAEQLGAGNFAVIWHDATGTVCPPSPAADQPPPAS